MPKFKTAMQKYVWAWQILDWIENLDPAYRAALSHKAQMKLLGLSIECVFVVGLGKPEA